jgi:D-amino-acid oxidase
MTSTRGHVVIIGAGVVGLTTAVRLAEDGRRVTIYAHRRGRQTSSYAAGAIFDPLMARHAHRDAWAATTRRELVRLHHQGHPWVRLLTGVEASRFPMRAAPEWAQTLPGYRLCEAAELPPGFAFGWRYRAPLVEMPPYLAWLEQQLEERGVEIRKRRLETLDEAFDDAEVVVNCSGIGAGELVPDGEMQSIRGQLVAVRNPGIHEFFVEHAPDPVVDTTYVLPQGGVLLLGGNAEKSEPEPAVDLEVAAAIRERCASAFPQIAETEVLGHRVGIRPRRTTVRLEHQDCGSRHIVHNYGHGGSGVSLAWGCAEEVTGIVAGLMARSG